MDISDFTRGNSPYLKAGDLQGKTVKVTISGVEMQEMRDGQMKPCIFFQNKSKSLVANITNCRVMEAAYSSDTQQWEGKEVELYTETTTYGPGLRVKPLSPGASAVHADMVGSVQQQQNAEAQQASDDEFDDLIPF